MKESFSFDFTAYLTRCTQAFRICLFYELHETEAFWVVNILIFPELE